MRENRPKTKVLFVDQDDTLFQIGQCIAKVLNQLPPMELFHACDATEALALIENLKPDVVVLDDEVPEERDLFIDGLGGNRPRIVIQTQHGKIEAASLTTTEITRIQKNESLEGIHQVLVLAATIAEKNPASAIPSSYH